eukprot:scaffold6798_cov108-Isochrysis_galbana.AAC.7
MRSRSRSVGSRCSVKPSTCCERQGWGKVRCKGLGSGPGVLGAAVRSEWIGAARPIGARCPALCWELK